MGSSIVHTVLTWYTGGIVSYGKAVYKCWTIMDNYMVYFLVRVRFFRCCVGRLALGGRMIDCCNSVWSSSSLPTMSSKRSFRKED